VFGKADGGQSFDGWHLSWWGGWRDARGLEIDPLRAGVREAIATCHSAGIAVWMVTGDHPATALAIARDLGLATERDRVVTGMELAGQSPQQFFNRKKINVLTSSSYCFSTMKPKLARWRLGFRKD
jgi:phosphoserine phosphatase